MQFKVGDKIHIPNAGIYNVAGIYGKPNMDIRIWLVAEQQDEKGCYDGAVLANSDISPTLYVTLMSAKDSPVPEILTLPEVEPTSVWMLNELKMHRDP